MNKKKYLKFFTAIPLVIVFLYILYLNIFKKSEDYVIIAGRTIHVETASNDHERSLGLMFRDSIKKDSGMLFIFSEEETLSFWMKDTFIPLDIAFIDSAGIILSTATLHPHDTTPVSSIYPARFALEVNQGYFNKHSISPGSTVYFSPGVQNTEVK